MALSGKKTGKDLVFKLDTQAGVEKTISGYVISVSGLPGDVDMADVTVGGSTGYKYYPGLSKAEISLECVFDDAVDGAYDVAKNFMTDTATRTIEFGPAGSTSGYVKITAEAWIKKVSLPAKASELLMFSIDLVVDGAITVGTYT